MSDNFLKGKVVLVSGAGSGLGEATARAFAHAGCNVVCMDINGEAAERVRRDLSGQEQDIKCIALQCDVGNAEAVFKRVEAVEAHFARLDIVVNCAAVDHTVSVNEMTVEQWDQVINVNLRGPFLLAKAALPLMRRQHSGHIINIASTAATRAWARTRSGPPSSSWDSRTDSVSLRARRSPPRYSAASRTCRPAPCRAMAPCPITCRACTLAPASRSTTPRDSIISRLESMRCSARRSRGIP